MYMFIRLRRTFITVSIFLVFSFVLSSSALAQDEDILGVSYGAASGLGGGDVRIVVANIISVALALLGIIAVLLMLYAGFTWMTAGGNEDKVATAKKTIMYAVIGLAIIMTSYAIMRFVIGELQSATTRTRVF